MIILDSTSYGLCFDIASGKAPIVARERFIKLVAEAIKKEDYEWLAMVSDEDAIEELIKLHPKMRIHYEAKYSDNIGDFYDYNVFFNNGTVIHFTLWSIWPECPDYDITEQETLEHIRLIYISDVTRYYQ